jgi:1-acyl-sn-glycerol-3-phosphate acyltransferase
LASDLITRRPPREQDAWWKVATVTVGALSAAAFRCRVTGLANVPSRGGALLAYNHLSVLDAIFVGVPIGRLGRIVRCFALAQDFERPLLGPALRRVGAIPIRRGAGDWDALRELAGVVEGGWLGGIAPEGTVGSGARLGPIQKGAARIALLAGVPVVPVGIWGTQERWPQGGLRMERPIRPRVGVSFGPPIVAEGDPKYRPDVQDLTDRIGAGIGDQVVAARGLTRTDR